MNKFKKPGYLLCIFCLLCLSITTKAEPHTYTIGVVPQFSALRTIEIWQPVLDAISHDTGIALHLQTSPGIPDFEKSIYSGSFDLAYMNPYHLIIANQKQGYLPVLRDIDRRLYGIIVVNKNSDIDNVSQLDGATVAFPAPNEGGAKLIPRAELDEKFNIHPEQL